MANLLSPELGFFFSSMDCCCHRWWFCVAVETWWWRAQVREWWWRPWFGHTSGVALASWMVVGLMEARVSRRRS